MRLIVFGASGNCGSHAVRLASTAGHDVIAIVRAATPYMAPQGVTVIRGDVLDAEFVARVVPGHDAVISALGMRYRHPWARRESPDDFTSRATGHIVKAMRTGGDARISVISAAGVGDSRAGANWPIRFLIATSNVGYAYRDLERVEGMLRDSTLDWQAVRPTTLSERKGSPGGRGAFGDVSSSAPCRAHRHRRRLASGSLASAIVEYSAPGECRRQRGEPPHTVRTPGCRRGNSVLDADEHRRHVDSRATDITGH